MRKWKLGRRKAELGMRNELNSEWVMRKVEFGKGNS